MLSFVAGLSSVLAGEPASPTPALPPHRVYPTAAAALDAVLASNPHILGIGELHSTTAGPEVPSTLSLFTAHLFPALAPHLTDLVLETWRVDGACGAPAAEVTEKVEVETERPPETKSDLVLLIEAAVAAGVRPHDLAFSCAEYEAMLDPKGDVRFGELLRLLTEKLQAFALLASATPNATMVLYGGAVHNDLFPAAALASYAYGPETRKKAGIDYVELDLYQPELLTPTMTEASWAALLTATGPDRVVLYERGPQSFVLLLPSVPIKPG
ncbi:hypothetical protein LBMAG42_13060 [Deltaproteobacteria bacterium]|nr:hypothetical protein LBMAG42_13060 [Deltaproteobacteria bacterium]